MASELEPNNASTNASSLVADTYMEGALSSSSDLDIFKIPSTGLTTASYVTFDFDSPLSAPLTSAYKLTVLDSSGTATSTTSSSGADVTLPYTVTAANANKTLYLKVDANSSSEGVGETYKLKYTTQSISENTQDNVVDSNNSTSTADALIPSVAMYGKLDSATDTDLFSFTTGSSGTVTLDFTGFSTSQASNFYTTKITYVNGATRQTKSSLSGETMSVTPSGAATASQISFTSTAQTTYYVDVGLTSGVTYDTSLASNYYALNIGGTTDFNQEPVIKMSATNSGVTGTTRSSGITKSVAKNSNTNLTDLFTASDPNSSDSVTEYYVKVIYIGSDNGGYIQNGGAKISADNGSGGYATIAAADIANAKYYGGSSSGSQTLKVWAKDSSLATDSSGYSGILSMALTTTDAQATAAVDAASDANITEGSNTDISKVNLALSGGSAHSSNVIVGFSPDSDITVKDVSGNVLTGVTFATSESSKSVYVHGLSDTSAEGTHTGVLNFNVTSSDASYNNLVIAPMTFAISEDVATFSVSSLAFKNSDGTASTDTTVTEGSTVYGEYTVSLSSTPANNISVAISAPSDVTSDPTNFTISKTATGSDLVKTIKLTATNDTVQSEGRESHIVTHTVTETGVAASQLTVSNIGINVDDNDSTPSVSTGQSFTVKKTVAVGSNFATVVATDADSADTLTYSILSQTNASNAAVDLFSIDSITGALSVKNDISSAAGTYSIAVKALDDSALALSDSQTVSIVVSSSTENSAPTLLDKTVTLSEAATARTSVAVMSASDADGDSLTYAITAGDTSLFYINPTTGAITVSKAGFDYETTKSYTLTVTASDATLSTTGTLTVNLSDENDNSPVFSESVPTLVSLNVGASSGTEVATFSATDVDGDAITYSLSGSNSSFFAINSSGVITTSKALAASGTISYWLGSTPLVKNKDFSFESIGESSGNLIDVTITATDTGSKTVSKNLTVKFPSGDTSGTKTSGSSDGTLDFGDLSNGSSYKVLSAVAHSSDINLTFSGDVQAIVDSLSGKTLLSSSASISNAADFNESGSFDLSDASGLAKAIVSETGSKLLLFGADDSSTLSIAPATSMALNAVLLGDVDGSYATILA
jgi:hypothetical protein